MAVGRCPEMLRGSEIFVLHGEGCAGAIPVAVRNCAEAPENLSRSLIMERLIRASGR
ncbi:hypothetical protein MmTuc01_0195 [Methanosarcina mazei Tuc01]|uniref:Uncharacterized protein n=1 Tax=Methanosarcina mazei Tuc01 TaxID=1236903 RepID=M1Q674_METMZ|nr:hypothetical protein [Methanosarcina mazei]AGF95648.1 hypothetical protein MmTuc01_0195 [Methanosarcina mazei Tuc01]